MSKRSKATCRKAHVVRITHEPYYRDEVWDQHGVTPTPATHPDAFLARREPAYPRPKVGGDRPRKTPHMRLSKTVLRKRLYQAGVRGAQINKLALEILAGPPATDLLSSTGLVALGWNVDAFREHFGKRIARAVFRFVSQGLIVVDEFGSWADTALIAAVENSRLIKVANIADVGYADVHLKALREHTPDRDSLPTFAGGAIGTMLVSPASPGKVS